MFGSTHRFPSFLSLSFHRLGRRGFCGCTWKRSLQKKVFPAIAKCIVFLDRPSETFVNGGQLTNEGCERKDLTNKRYRIKVSDEGSPLKRKR